MPITGKIVNNKLILELPLIRQPSATGKNIVVATTRGNHAVDGLQVDGKAVIVGVNAYFKAA